ncbi:MAG: restriction endonuclease subunit R [Okeania sp. SIO2C2]|uniref:restriction endonuclease subunit R n=1 Tax=Okeania sp. SIO2C2 TaxID=2607787 RepID=UPI0013BB708A|nr:restriction endonuclease subunit R [Okeania sp. SIO2C2]NEP88682.1 restriction endonuclease subunit R [Okeania sp. SIO2C2]
MVKTIQSQEISLRYLIDNFSLQLVRDEQFFREWQDDLPEISDWEKELLNQVKEGYFNLLQNPPFLEDIVRMAIVDPILFIGKFFLYPYHIRSEKPINLELADKEVIIRGRIDALVMKEQLWVMVIESKRAEFSIEAGLAQLLTYLMASPYPEHPNYGLIVTGGSFIFVKLIKTEVPQYATSKMFAIRNPGNELFDVLRILKRLSKIVINRHI